MDGATFTLKLIDAVTGPARSASKALGSLRGALGGMGDAQASSAKAMGMGGGSGPSVGRGFSQIAKAARAAEGFRMDQEKEAKKSNPARGFSEIAKAAKAAEGMRRDREKSAGNAFKGFSEIAKAARAAKSGGFDGSGNKKKAHGKESAVGDFVKGTLIAGGLEKALEIVTELTKEIVLGAAELITFGQNARFAFDQLAKHGATGDKLFEHSRALAVRFGLDVEDTTHTYADFLKLQFNPKQADEFVRLGADMQALGADATNLKSIFLAIGQIKSLGKLQGGDLRQLEQAGISGQLIYEELGKSLGGKNAVEVQKLERAGKISADMALDAIKSAIKRKLQEKGLGDAGAKFADNTLSGITGRFKAIGMDTGLKLVEKMTAPLTALAKVALGKFENLFEGDGGEKTIDAIASALGKAAGFAGDFIGAFGSGFGDTLGKIWDGFKPLVDALGGSAGSGLSTELKAIGKYMGELAAAGLVVVGVAAVLGLGFEYLLATVAQVGIGIVTGLTDPLFKMVDDVLGWWFKLEGIWDEQGVSMTDKALGIGKQIVMGFVGGMESLLAYPLDAISGIADGTIAALKSALGIHSPSKAAQDVGGNFTGTYADTLQAGVSDAKAGGAALGMASAHGLNTTSSGAFGPLVSSLASPPTIDTAQSLRSGGRLGNFSPSFTFELHNSGDPEETAKLAAREARREFEAFFRQIEMET